MQRLRSIWLGLVGGAVILAFSVSAALGAPPTEGDGPRGQSISAFVHELIFGTEDQTDDDEVVEGDEDEDVGADDEADEELDEGADSERQVPDEFANHGECVSEATQDTEGFEASDATNHGEWVSTHARYDCWGLEPPGADEEASLDEGGDTELATAKEERKAAKEAAKAERRTAREAAKAERQAAREAVKAERRAGKGH